MKPSLVAGIALTAIALLPPGQVRAESERPGARLMEIQKELQATRRRNKEMRRKADAAAAEIGRLKLNMVRAAGDAQAHEAEMTRLESRISFLTARIAKSTESLRQKRKQMIILLAALERLAQHPPVALAARPGDPVDTVRSAILMRAAVPALEVRAKSLARELRALAGFRAELSRQRNQLAVSDNALNAKRRELARLISVKAIMERNARAASAAAESRAKELAGEAQNLKELLARLESQRRTRIALERREHKRAERQRRAAKRRDIEIAARRARALTQARERERRQVREREEARLAAVKAREEVSAQKTEGKPKQVVSLSVATASTITPGARALPARGRLIRLFGERTSFGNDSKGVSIRTRPAAQVVAPRGGEVVFAGHFRGYGQLLIIRHDDGHHALLSGMEQIDAIVGDQILAGEPVGTMTSKSDTRPTLYLELRRNGRPINPMPWLAASRSKVSG